MIKILFYISNHGYGHSTRMYALANEFIKLGIHSILSTNRNKEIFQNLNQEYITYRYNEIDCEIVHHDWQNPNNTQIRQNLLEFLNRKDKIIDNEVDFIIKEKISFIIADIPFLAFPIAQKANVISCGISNFDWYEQYIYFLKEFDDENTYNALDYIKKSYSLADFSLVLPFSGDINHCGMSCLRSKIPAGLLAGKAKPNRNKILKDFNIPEDKFIILLSFTDRKNFHFDNLLANNDLIILSKDKITHPNYRDIPEDYNYQLLLASVDAVVTKSGYSTLAEACQYGKTIFYMTRKNFPEDEFLSLQLASYPLAFEIKIVNNQIEIPFEKLLKDKTKTIPSLFKNANIKVAKDCLTEYFKHKKSSNCIKCILEIGTNNILLLIVKAESGNNDYLILHRASFVTEMGKDIKDNLLSYKAIKKTKIILRDILNIIDLSLIETHLIGTWACRTVSNINEISCWLKSRFNLNLNIISEEIECYYNSLSLLSSFPQYSDIFAFDIGGGSTEFIFIKNKQVVFERSTDLGIRNLHNKFKDSQAKQDYITSVLKSLNLNIAKNTKIIFIGIGGIFTSIYSMIYDKQRESNFSSAHNALIKKEDIDNLMIEPKNNSFFHLKNYHKKLQIMYLGIELVSCIIEYFDIKEIVISDRSPQFGYLEEILSIRNG